MTPAVEPALSPASESAPNMTAAGETTGGRAFWDRFGRTAVVSILAVTLAGLILVIPALAINWQRQPFLGAFLEHTLILNDTGASAPQPWPAFAAGAQPGDQLLSIDGASVRTSQDVAAVLSTKSASQTVQLALARPGTTGPVSVSVSLNRFSSDAFVTYFGIPYFVALVYLAIGLLVFWLRRGEAAGRAFALFCTTAAIGLGGVFDLYTTHWFTWAWTLAVPAAGAALMTLGQVFPQESRMAQRQPGARLLPFIPALLLAAYALYTLYSGSDPRAYIAAWRYEYLFLGAGILVFLATMAYRRLTSRSPIAKEQTQVIMLGALVAMTPLLIWTLLPLVVRDTAPINIAIVLPVLVLFPAAAAYAILRYRLLETDFFASQVLIYAVIAVVTLAGYGLILTGATLIFGALVQPTHPIVVGLAIFLLVAGFNPLRERLQALVNNAFFRGQRGYTQQLEGFGRALTRAAAIKDIAVALDAQLSGALQPSHIYLFLRNPVGDDYTAYAEASAPAEASLRLNAPRIAHTDLRFAGNGALAGALARERAAIYLTPDTPLPAQLLPDRARLAVLGSAVYVPLPGQSGLAGWLALGPKLSGQPMTRDDLRFAESLADQSALAIERASVISDLERRVRELNVLSQMSQAVNFTLNYDDLLELIYAQASKVVDTRNFYVILKEPRGDNFSYAFYVENDERETGEEHKPWPAGRGLESEVWRTGQPIRTDDYVAECRRRGVAPRSRQAGRLAWLGVPLNAGAETIGVMATAAQRSDVTFSEDQQKIFWAIADQAASAMVKAQLLERAEERARQLSMLNELSTSMASSLELVPLLERIVNSSMGMIGCEAASLFLTDEDTGEYVFTVAAGPVGHDLIGMRIAPGKGFVGEAIETATVVIVNDVQTNPRWFRGSDQTTGFVTQALMVVPLRRGEHTIGALEVINKRDGSDFNNEERALLAAFAGQAAVAIENARLFAQTDQALTDRVGELSMMQRIDRELNAALDVQRVMTLTLDWSMKNTLAYAGSVGIVTEDGISIVATSGYGDTVEGLRDRPLPIDRGLMGRVARTGVMSHVPDVRVDPDYRGILPATRSQLTIPIMREKLVIGLINLESPEVGAFSEDQVAFMTRLLDHASVAIANARLYAEVNAANIAKSDFVSVAAHELKTPMTAIKMSSELMLAGAVGAINETQRQFLSTIKNNLDRMTTIVTDLNDVTRLETGRMKLDSKAMSFQAVVDEVLRGTRGLFASKEQTLTLDIPSNIPYVYADSDRTAQVLTNLLSNAYKYTPDKGEVTLRVRVAAAEPAETGGTWVNSRSDTPGPPPRPQLHIAVQDSGIGISHEDQRRLFQKFFRSDDRTAREMASGTGLGLNIVKNLVELQGGRIWVESEFRRGSTFNFTLPLADTPAAQAVKAAGMTTPGLGTLDKAHLLALAFAGVAEDELEELAGVAKVNTYPAGTLLCREGSYEDIFYIVASGEAVITKTISPVEGERVLRQVGAGDYVGEMALIQNAPRAASVLTTSDCTVLEIDKADFEAILSRSPRLALSIIRTTLNRMRANDQVAIHDLQRTNRVLAQLDRNKLEFIEIAAHELRTPLTVMKGYLNVLRQDEGLKGDSIRQEVLEGLNHGTERLHEIVNTMLDVTRIDTEKPGGVRIAAVPVPLKSVVNDIVRRLQHEALDRHLQIDIEHAAETLVINADPTLIQKALYQVIVNAIKYTPDAGQIQIRTALVTMPNGQPAVQISVRDAGIGLDPEHHELIFEKFYQVGSVALHSSGKTVFKGGGPGLGLAIVRGVVRAHGGRVWVESAGYDEVNFGGSTFFLQFPIQPLPR